MRAFLSFCVLGLLGGSPPATAADATPTPTAALERAVAAAEASLKDGELQSADSHYRSALLEGWLLIGDLQAAEGKLAEAGESYRRAASAAVETRRALRALALVHMRSGDLAAAERLLNGLAQQYPGDTEARRLQARALTMSGKTEDAVQVLEEAHAAAPDDLELSFALASGYLRLQRPDAAAPLLDAIAKARPIPQTHVLIGRTYRDFRQYARARAELEKALELDPAVRRAHYYLGTLGLMEEGPGKLEIAISQFRKELEVSPADPVVASVWGSRSWRAGGPRRPFPRSTWRRARRWPTPRRSTSWAGRSWPSG
jgi:tetratricopeptide (TPR) repeat protein